MKIERMYLYNSDMAENMQNVYNYLLENAVPKYFDSVTISEDKFTISCYIGENKFLEIKKENSGQTNLNTFHVYIYTQNTINTITQNNDGINAIIGGIPTNGAGKPVFITYAYKCKNSISFCASESVEDTMNKRIKFTVTKDDAGNTAVVCMANYQVVTGENKTNKIYTGSENSNVLSLLACVNSAGQSLTAKIPFFVGNVENYTPDVFLTPYTEYSTPGILEMDGVYYVSNGLWCCKE